MRRSKKKLRSTHRSISSWSNIENKKRIKFNGKLHQFEFSINEYKYSTPRIKIFGFSTTIPSGMISIYDFADLCGFENKFVFWQVDFFFEISTISTRSTKFSTPERGTAEREDGPREKPQRELNSRLPTSARVACASLLGVYLPRRLRPILTADSQPLPPSSQ